MRDRKGKSARILEKIKKSIGIDISESAQEAEKEILKESETSENKKKLESKEKELKKEKK